MYWKKSQKEENDLQSLEASKYTIDFPLDSLLSFDSETELKAIFGKNVERGIGRYP
ncbi:hypothetical protein J8281_06555 [Aquimarina sp. U1-2]|uniref:hypothetical protein n=1 Tax=Aquimarina sp. U1-2 TaxID=2823141 RepID=UPI001AEC8C36|nr:hypothetical protein [Aquimarina sp. U1-2]MBP2831846.1 hypothetical protein [Aquimarina sp. U1-2]